MDISGVSRVKILVLLRYFIELFCVRAGHERTGHAGTALEEASGFAGRRRRLWQARLEGWVQFLHFPACWILPSGKRERNQQKGRISGRILGESVGSLAICARMAERCTFLLHSAGEGWSRSYAERGAYHLQQNEV